MKRLRRPRSFALVVLVLAIVGGNSPVVVQYVSADIHSYEIDRPAYKAKYGQWKTIELPDADRVDAVHTALLQTGKLLIIAGSGNNQQEFNAGSFKTLVWDPVTGKAKLIKTPTDMFCGGHAFLPNGDLLVAGGTSRYEVLAENVTYAGGVMNIENSLPERRELAKGTTFVAPNGEMYKSDVAVTLPPARTTAGAGGRPTVQPSREDVWVNAAVKGAEAAQPVNTIYRIIGPGSAELSTLKAVGADVSLKKQDFQGTNASYIFDPIAERYDYVPPMPHKRWYPTVAPLKNGNLIAVSGLDGASEISPGNTDIFNVKTKTWGPGPFRYFPTYPALFLTTSGKLFFSGSNYGYGPATQGRTPGLWNLQNDSFQDVPGLADAEDLETSGSVLLPPAQAQKVMVLGGGGIAESAKTTARTAIASLNAKKPSFVPGPNLAQATRYPLSVILPDDNVLVTGGSRYYRGEHASDNHIARIYDPATNKFTKAADPAIGRDYHSEAVLLPDGRVATLGSNPLFADKDDSITAKFEQRIEIYSPPYLFDGPRPVISGGPKAVALGGSATFTTSNPENIAKIRLIHPSAATHDIDIQQRSIAVAFTRTANGVHITVPRQRGLVPLGWYMMFIDNGKGVPSVARWVRIT
jgi:Domain of unknown function (DUF1929)